jgi:methanogenic corrinoid protein MtbC1
LLSPKDLALAIGVSESSLKRWADEGRIRVSRTAGGHRRIPIAEAIRFVRESQATLVRPEILGLPDVEAVAGQLPAGDGESAELQDYLARGAAREARGLLLSMYLSGRSIARICDGAVRDAMTEIGCLWQHTPEGIFIEHRATDICFQAINQVRLTFPEHRNGIAAVGGAPTGDPYMLPSLMAATVLSGEGIRAVNLGATTPAKSLLQAVDRHDARFAWLSVSFIPNKSRLAEEVRSLVAGMRERQRDLVLGGRLIEEVAIPSSPGVHVGRSMAELAAFARGLEAAGRRDAPENASLTNDSAS